MDRRSFLRALGIGAAAVAATAVLDPEFALWKPGAKAYSLPATQTFVARDPQTGMSIRMVKDYQIESGLFVARFDVLYGWATIRPDLAVRVTA